MYIKFGDRSQNRQTEKSKWPINVPRSYIRHFKTVIHRVRNEKNWSSEINLAIYFTYWTVLNIKRRLGADFYFNFLYQKSIHQYIIKFKNCLPSGWAKFHWSKIILSYSKISNFTFPTVDKTTNKIIHSYRNI